MEKGDLKRRFFIAVFPPPHVTAALKKLERKGPGDWDWKRQKDYHISIAFPGNLTEEQARQLADSLKSLRLKSFDLSFDALRAFMTNPVKRYEMRHVLWAKPEDAASAALQKIQDDVVDFLKKNRMRHGITKTNPHLTVARTPPEAGTLTREFAKAHGSFTTPVWRCDRIEIRETLPKTDPDHPANNGGRGSRYRKFAEIMLEP